MNTREFLDILTRVVNSKSGPKFLAVLHQLREILAEAGIAEEATARLEPGKPLRQRAPGEVDRRTREPAERPTEPATTERATTEPTNGTEGESSQAQGNAGPAPAETIVDADDGGPGAALTPAQGEPAEASEFIEAGPNRLIRNPEPPQAAAEEPAAEAAPPDSIRAIVQEALEGGGKTMAQIRQIIHEKKGPVSHIVAQVQAAIEKLGAQKGPRGMYVSSSAELPPPRKRASKSRIASVAEGVGPDRTPPSAADDADADDDGLKQLSLLEDASATNQTSDSDRP